MNKRLMKVAYPWPVQLEYDTEVLNARYRLDRLHWLSTAGVQFSFDVDGEISQMRKLVPDWEEASCIGAKSGHAETGILALDTSFQHLDDLHINQIIVPGQGNEVYDFRHQVTRRPFAGLVEKNPTRALAALSDAARRDHYPVDAWSFMLLAEGSPANAETVLRALGHQLAALPREALTEIVDVAAIWLRRNASVLMSHAKMCLILYGVP